MTFYLNFALHLCRITATRPSFLLHPLDLIGGDLIRELSFFPGMDVETEKKTDIFKKVLGKLARHFSLVNMSEHADFLLQDHSLKARYAFMTGSMADQ
jgi:hypothetical protein